MRSLSRRAFARALLAPWVPAALTGCRRRSSTAPPPARATLEIDAGQTLGPFERLSGVQGSPAPIVQGEPERVREFRDVGIALSRFPQDCYPNTLTLAGIFPDEAADPDSPASYRFEGIDRHVRAARAAGADVLWQSSYDVGRSDRWVGINLGGRAPENLERWSRVVSRCLEHFNNGFAQGFDYAVRNVEFVNEPDGLGGFTAGHRERLVPAFLAFLATVERYNLAHPSTPVRAVGPGIPLSFAEWSAWKPRFDAALRELRRSGRSLPVFSFHTYGRDVSPRANERLARELRVLLDQHGFGGTELWNTEWQAGDFLRKHLGIDAAKVASASADEQRQFGSAMAAYAVACKIRWQGLVRGSCYYRANLRAFPPDHEPPRGGARLGFAQFFGADATPRPLALQERLLSLVAEATPERCPTSFSDDGLFSALGSRSPDGKTVSLLCSNLAVRPHDLVVQVDGVRGNNPRARVVRLESRADLGPTELPPPSLVRGRLALEVTVGPLSSAWWVIEASG